MDTDNLKEMWQQYDAELKRNNMLNETLVRKMLKDGSSAKARNLSLWEYTSLAICCILLVLFVSLWNRTAEVPGLMAFYIVDMLWCVFFVIWNIYKLSIINKIDSNDSVVNMQEQVNKLRRTAAREMIWGTASIPLVMCCMIPPVHNWVLGGNALDHIGMYIPRVLAGGFIGIVLTIWIYKRFVLKDIQTIADNQKEIDLLKNV